MLQQQQAVGAQGHRYAHSVCAGIVEQGTDLESIVQDVAVAEGGTLWQRSGATGELNVDGVRTMQLLRALRYSISCYFVSTRQQVIPVTCLNKDRALQARHCVAALLEHAAVIRRLERFRCEEQRQPAGVHRMNQFVQAVTAEEERVNTKRVFADASRCAELQAQ